MVICHMQTFKQSTHLSRTGHTSPKISNLYMTTTTLKPTALTPNQPTSKLWVHYWLTMQSLYENYQVSHAKRFFDLAPSQEKIDYKKNYRKEKKMQELKCYLFYRHLQTLYVSTCVLEWIRVRGESKKVGRKLVCSIERKS